MSTRCSLVSGKNFHLFEEALDPTQNVWLELDRCAFEASPNRVRLEIPLAVWEVIRQHSPARFDLVSLTNAQLRTAAEKRVDATRADYREAVATQRSTRESAGRKRRNRMLSVFYRDARLPRGEHLARVLEKLRSERAAQRKLRLEIARLVRSRSQ